MQLNTTMLQRTLTLIVALFFFAILSVRAQENESSLIRAKIKHGSLLLGGNLQGSYQLTTSELNSTGQKVDGRRIDFNLRSKNGYFVFEDFAVGLDVSVLHQSSKITEVSDTEREASRETFVMAGPFVRYYMLNGVFGELTMLAGLNNFNDVNRKYKALEGGAGLGYAFFVNRQFSLEPVISMRYFRKVDRDGRAYSEFGPMIGFGLQAYLLRQKSHVIKRAL
ncbi:hypothetical protein [Pontibacter ramchanderi]|uniref:Outer membrane protein with beta-barrel domain n=1 Tax=Pontibacter ramchanderi TaxID=1179743 RepID=A0A2N3V167_9BACT|nr:hypothetical protein [Pontibacter ramchanderi]PKV75367.1 hypothetical protein BD749_0309 [Pontibacter ramchanderi]